MAPTLDRTPIAAALDGHRSAMLRELRRLAQANPAVAQEEADATTRAMQQVLTLEAAGA